MSGSGPQIRASCLAGLAELLIGTYGINIEPLLDEVSIEHGALVDETRTFPLHRFAQLLELASERTGEECFGMAFADIYPRGASGVLGYLIMSSPDLRTAVTCLRRFARLQLEGVDLDLEEQGGLAHLTWNYGTTVMGPRRQLTEFFMALFSARARQMLGNEWALVSAEFDYREPNHVEKYYEVFSRQLRFEADRNRIVVRSDILSRANAEADRGLYKILRKVADRELDELKATSDLLACLGEKIVEQLPLEGIDLEGAAAALQLSTRQLQSHLKRRGTTFEAELSRVRERLATHYLHDTDMAMTEIALMLGFSELSSFTRAARSWYGMPPTAYREQARRSGGELS